MQHTPLGSQQLRTSFIDVPHQAWGKKSTKARRKLPGRWKASRQLISVEFKFSLQGISCTMLYWQVWETWASQACQQFQCGWNSSQPNREANQIYQFSLLPSSPAPSLNFYDTDFSGRNILLKRTEVVIESRQAGSPPLARVPHLPDPEIKTSPNSLVAWWGTSKPLCYQESSCLGY